MILSEDYNTNTMGNGTNRAQDLETLLGSTSGPKAQALLESYIRCIDKYKRGKICVFISHKSCDKDCAQRIGDYLNAHGLDVYLDLYDNGLQGATLRKDAKEIVRHIQMALDCSTHILVLISKETQQSWWVPYEIGYAKKGGRGIASIVCSNIEVPDYLQIEHTMQTKNEFYRYVSDLQKQHENR